MFDSPSSSRGPLNSRMWPEKFLRVREEGLGRGRKAVPLDPHEFFSGGIEDSNARQRHRLGEHTDDEKFVFDVVHGHIDLSSAVLGLTLFPVGYLFQALTR